MGLKTGGIEGKWQAMTEERDALKETVEGLQKVNAELKAKLDRLEGTELASVVSERDDLRKQRQLEVGEIVNPSDDELEVIRWLEQINKRIVKDWGLVQNGETLTSAIHLLQQFPVQHMLSRIAPHLWPSWWKSEETQKGKTE